jgi:CDP-Glycerol:Poly(glycerophosphate) glycerophosphotransferase
MAEPREVAGVGRVTGGGGPIWLVLPDPFSSRLFLDCGIVGRLRERIGERLELVLLQDPADAATWAARAPGSRVIRRDELLEAQPSLIERVVRRADRWLDRQIGFYPLSLRQSIRFGFNRERMRPGHPNWFLDPDRAGPLPHWDALDPLMARWHFGRLRYVPPALLARLRRERPAIVLANSQMHATVPLVVAGRRLGLPLVGHLASWDHTVGKGIVPPFLRRYIVQNRTMQEDLVRYHGIEGGRVVVTGWPQTDVFHAHRPREAYEALLARLRLDGSRPVVLYAGNTPTNAPHEPNLVRRLVEWWRSSREADRFSLLFRPHPRDRDAPTRFAAAAGQEGAAVQVPSFTDLEDLATLLQHVECVVANAGTILLDALVNDRAAVCVTFDEGVMPGERPAGLNLGGEHYRKLAQSAAFYRADSFDELAEGIRRALAAPQELAAERRRVAREVVGEVDGHAAERVADAVAGALDRDRPVALR